MRKKARKTKLYEHQKEALEVTADQNHVAFYHDYIVTSDGKVFSCKSNKYLKPTEHNGKQPYYYVSICIDGKAHKEFIHRLVAKAFISNPKNLPQVNHIDGNIHNNDVSNLEWVSNQENTIHAYKNHLRTHNVIWVFNGLDYVPLRKACEELGLNYKKVHYRLNRLKWDFNRAIDYKGGGNYVMCETLPASV